MKFARLSLFAIPIIFASGCIQSHRYPPLVYTPVPAAVVPPTPTSDVPAVRVYPELPPGVTTAPPGVSESDLAIADSIREVLKGNGPLSGTARNVEATVNGGVVTLKGIVDTDTARQEIASRIAGLPGVTRVDNELSVQLR